MVGNKYYAIRIGNWVEIRQAHEPPNELKSEVEIKTKERVYDYWSDRYKTKTICKTLKQSTFKGGKVIKQLKSRSFATKAGFTIKNDHMVELTRSVVKKFIQES